MKKREVGISGLGLLLLILSGSYFASITESIKQGWLLTSLAAIVFALGIGRARPATLP